jgi:DNA (cytosine-5)-methyltransferase 1
MVIDLFAGPGGWDEAARGLGVPVIGIEWDASACATRAAAGHLTIRADVAEYPVEPFLGKAEGLIASPPCPTFSAAGDGTGRDEMPHLFAAAVTIQEKGWVDPWTLHQWSDPRTPLVLQPLRWVAALRPEWMALEQVPAVAPLWELYGQIWREAGYSVWSGVLNAADFGVPQTRQRAILIASRTRPAVPPEPTHCKGGSASLFGALAPWVSMADALGWGASERPCVTVTGGGTRTGGAEPLAHPRRFVERERERESWIPAQQGTRDA